MGAGGEDLSVSRSEDRQRSTWGCGTSTRAHTEMFTVNARMM
jgi:hypothetical protein